MKTKAKNRPIPDGSARTKNRFPDASASNGPAIRGSKDNGNASDDILAQLRSGSEEAFRRLYRQHQKSLVEVALHFVRDRATAEELVQDTWLAVVEGLSKFEGRSSLKNWIFAILANKARSRAVRDARVVAVGSLDGAEVANEPVPTSRFDPADDWSNRPEIWDELNPERIVSGRRILAHVSDAIDKLPPAQRSVLILRDVEQMETAEICEILGVSQANQRVLLHRARAQVREFIGHLLASDHANVTTAVTPSRASTPRVFGISPRVTPMIELKELV